MNFKLVFELDGGSADAAEVSKRNNCPVSSGNDLARILRWGPGYGSEDPHHILVSVDEADEVLMDRWTILLDAQDMSEDGKDNDFLEPPKVWSASCGTKLSYTFLGFCLSISEGGS